MIVICSGVKWMYAERLSAESLPAVFLPGSGEPRKTSQKQDAKTTPGDVRSTTSRTHEIIIIKLHQS